MRDLRREIVNQVASGKITPEEGAARLASLETVEAPSAPLPVVAQAPADTGTRRVRVSSVVGSAEVVGDPTITYAIAEGPHRARQNGDLMVIEQGPFDGDEHFSFGPDRRVAVNSLDFGKRKLRVRMNPDLALHAQVNAGSLRIEGVHGPITAEILAGNCRISDFEAPLDISTQAGNVSASGRLDGGMSTVRCEMGNVTINLEKGSSVKVSARTTMGKVAVETGGAESISLGQSGRDVTIGSGAGTLDIECSMGSVRVSS